MLLCLHPRGPQRGEEVTGALEWQPRLGALLAGACRVVRVKEMVCSQVEPTSGLERGMLDNIPSPPATPGPGLEPPRPGQGQRAGPGGSGNPGQGPLSLSPRRPPRVLTVSEPGLLQCPEELSANILTVPTGFSQALGH